jgi:hypothetical protein
MTLKTLLLGSAATFVAFGGAAQAADLSVAEPVESVRVCDAFGTGYWYIPGTETCIAIHGSVEFDVNIHSLSNVYYSGTHSSNWDFVTEAKLNFTAKSVTDYGDLVGYIGLIADYNNGPTSVPTTWGLDSAWLALGPLMAGHQSSTFDYGGDLGTGAIYRSDVGVDQVRLSWAMGGFGIMLGIEDPRDRWGSSLSYTYNMPDLVAAVTASQDKWDGKLAVGFAQIGAGSAWGVLAGVTVKLDSIAPGDLLRIQGAYGNGSYTYKTVTAANNTWSIYAGFKHFWSAQWSSVLEGSYVSDPSAAPTTMWTAGANLVWAPVTGFSAALQGVYTQPTGGTGVWTGKVALKRTW